LNGKVIHYDFDTSKEDNSVVGRYLEYLEIYVSTTVQLVKLVMRFNPQFVARLLVNN